MVVPEDLARAVLVPSPSCGLAGAGAENPVTPGELGIFMDQAAEPIPAQNPDICARSGRFFCGYSGIQAASDRLSYRAGYCAD